MNHSPNPRAARMAAGLTQAQAAMLIDAKRRTFQEWEGGRRNMPQSKFALFCILTGYDQRVIPPTPPAAAPAP